MSYWDLESRAHWVNFVFLFFKFFTTVTLLSVVFFWSSFIIFYDMGPSESASELIPVTEEWLGIFCVFILVVFVKFIHDILCLRSLHWRVGPEGIQHFRGVLPWRRIHWHWRYQQIFNAGFSHGLLGWMLGYGTLHIVFKDGTSSEVRHAGLSNVKKLQGIINRYLHSADPYS